MVRRRDLREDERELWEHVTRDVRKPRARKVAPPRKAVSDTKPVARKKLVAEPVRIAVAVAPPPAKRPAPAFGVDGATAERLRRGKIEPEAVLDLHGLTQAQAHTRLVTFVRRGHEMGNRCLLVITGKGAVLRELLPRWLEELRAAVTGVQSAHVRHGGGGAFYVYLRRKRAPQ